MKIQPEDLLEGILKKISRIDHIEANDIPNIDLYMDQVTTFMDSHLKSFRKDNKDKALTKTMINNYAKNKLLPPPNKKKYGKEHLLLLVFIYYFKNILSINDIQSLLQPITERYFAQDKDFNLETIYKEVFSLEKEQIEVLKNDVKEKFQCANDLFQEQGEEKEFLQLFSFICMLSFDVYVKKQLIESLIESLPEIVSGKDGKKGTRD